MLAPRLIRRRRPQIRTPMKLDIAPASNQTRQSDANKQSPPQSWLANVVNQNKASTVLSCMKFRSSECDLRHHQHALVRIAQSRVPTTLPPSLCSRAMVLGIVTLCLRALRATAEISFFLEAQRLLLRFVRPSSQRMLQRAEDALLAVPATPVRRRWVRANGHTMHTLVVGDERRPKLVMLHGHSMSGAFYFRNFDDLVAAGYCVIAVDLLGWGRSARPHFAGSTADDSLEWYLSSLIAWVRAMRLTRFALAGHSLGGYLALEFARRIPNAVDRLMLISPAACARDIPVGRALYFSLPPQSIVRRGGLFGFLLFMLYYPRDIMYVRDRLREYTYHLAAQSPPSGEVAIIPIIRVHSIRRASCVRPLIENLAPLPMPVQIVCGETDSSMRIEDVHDLYLAMKKQGNSVRINVVRGADHCPHLEKPREFFKAISEFCNPNRSAASFMKK